MSPSRRVVLKISKWLKIIQSGCALSVPELLANQIGYGSVDAARDAFGSADDMHLVNAKAQVTRSPVGNAGPATFPSLPVPTMHVKKKSQQVRYATQR